MKTLAMTLGTLLTVAAGTALAQDNTNRNFPFDPDAVARQQWAEAQGYYGYREAPYREPLYREEWRDDRREWRDERRELREQRRALRNGPSECWNPRARHYEEVRPGEVQNDLDFSRCRSLRWR